MLSTEKEDSMLWQEAREGNTKAFAKLFDNHWQQVFSIAFHYLRNTEACEELSHDIFLNLWLKRETLEIENLQAYLGSAARYHVFKALKNQKKNRLVFTDRLEDIALASSEPVFNQADTGFQSDELERSLNRRLENLPKRSHEIFLLSRSEQLSNDEIAHRLGISKRTVENQITHALRYLRLSMKEIMGGVSLFYLLLNRF